ncbi:hypothetical protein Ancab_014722 [Ancistrocladus abbreviatus]
MEQGVSGSVHGSALWLMLSSKVLVLGKIGRCGWIDTEAGHDLGICSTSGSFREVVFSHFVIGFPQDWKKCAEKRFGQFLAAEVLSKCNADSEPTVVTRTGNASPTLNRHFRKDESPSKEVIMDVPDNGRDLLLSAKLEFQDDGRMQSLKEDGFSHAVGNMQCHVSRSKPIVVREKRNASPTLKHPFLKDASLTNKVTMDRRDNDIHMLFKANLRLEDHRKIRSLKAKGNFEGMKKCSSSLLEAVTVKRSRSGRLLLPALEFWRNQLPIYDADHGLSAIKDGTAIVKLRNGWWRGEDGSLSVAHRKYKKG